MKKILAILMSASMFLAQINIVNAVEDITVSGGLVNIDLENSILYTSSAKIAVRDLQNLIEEGYTVTGYTDSSKSDTFSGYLDTGRMVTLTKDGKSVNLTVKRLTPFSMDEDFENIADGTDAYDFQYTTFNGNYMSNGNKTGYSTLTYEGLNANDTNKRVKLYINETAGNSPNAVIDTRKQGIKGPAVISLDILNTTHATGAVKIQINDKEQGELAKDLFSLGSDISYYGGRSETNTNTTQLKRMYAALDPYKKKVKIYYDGQLKSEAALNDFDYSKFSVRIFNQFSGKNGTESIAYIDNLKFYENASLDGDYAISPVKYTKDSKVANDLHSGEGNLSFEIESLTGKANQMKLVVGKYDGDTLKDVIAYQNVDVSTTGAEVSVDIDTSNCTYDDTLKVMMWESATQKPVYNYDLFVKDIVFKPYANEILNDFNANNTTAHPRIMANEDDFLRIVELSNENTTVEAWYNDLIAKADEIAGYTNTEINSYIYHHIYDGTRMLITCKRALNWLMTLGIAYKTTSESKYAKTACLILDNVCGLNSKVSFADWNHQKHFLDVGVMMQAVAIGLDWFDDYSPFVLKRSKYEAALFNYGIQKALDGYEEGQWWTNTNSNWNAECNGGLIMAALVLIDVDAYKDKALQALELAISNLSYCIEASYPDGGWVEGPTYALGAMKPLAMTIDSLEYSLGTDYGLTEILGYNKVGDFLSIIEGPRGINNYSDSGNEHFFNDSTIFWLAKKFNKPENAIHQLERQDEITDEGGLPLGILWYDPSFEDATAAVRPNDTYIGEVEVVTMREDWTTDNSMWLSFAGGRTSEAHAHFDCGAFVLDWEGYRWASDLGADNYDIPNYYDVCYRTRAEGHNTLVINPDEAPGQEKHSFAPISEKALNCDNPYAIVDLSPVYDTADATSVKRGFKMTDDRNCVFIKDEITLAKQSDIYWFMHSKADLELQSDNSVLMTMGEGASQKQMKLEFITDANSAEISIVNAEALSTSPTVSQKQESNAEFKKIQIKMTDSDNVNLTVRISPVDGNTYTSLSTISAAALNNWSTLN